MSTARDTAAKNHGWRGYRFLVAATVAACSTGGATDAPTDARSSAMDAATGSAEDGGQADTGQAPEEVPDGPGLVGEVSTIGDSPASGTITTYNAVVAGRNGYRSELYVGMVKPGDVITITNISGTVRFMSPFDPANCVYDATPWGYGRDYFDNPNNQLLCGYEQDCSPTQDPLRQPAHGHAGLMVRNGSYYAFVGGNDSFTMTATYKYLYVGVNDFNPTNNTGSFQARVTVRSN